MSKFIERLLGNEEARSGANLRVRITSEDLTQSTAATAQTIELLDVKKGDLIQLLGVYLETAFEDASDSAFNDVQVKVGDGVDDDRYLVATQVNKNGTEVDASAGTGTRFAYTADDTVDIVVGSMTAKKLSDIDKGSLVLLFKKVSLTELRG